MIHKQKLKLFSLIFSILIYQSLPAQNVNKENNKSLYYILGTELVLYSGVMIGLNQIWYKNYEKSAFHFINDKNQWAMYDKAGHCFSNYQTTKILSRGFEWSGLNKKTSAWLGFGTGLAFVGGVEILDGFSAGWGASLYDLGADILGAGLFLSQELLLKEQALQMKYSYHPSIEGPYRPDYFGEGLSRIVKDYNGQTIWLSINPESMLKTGKIPAWLNLSLGYGIDGMLGSTSNPTAHNGKPLPEFQRTRQYYISLDVNLSKIHTRWEFLNKVLDVLNILKIPFPALEFSDTGTRFYYLYF